jgi:hypothetical protein
METWKHLVELTNRDAAAVALCSSSSSSRTFVNISGTVGAIDLTFSHVKNMGLHV